MVYDPEHPNNEVKSEGCCDNCGATLLRDIDDGLFCPGCESEEDPRY